MRAGNKPRALLNRLLTERNQHPERAAAIDEKVRRAFERRVAILALDMCGFARLTARHGIVHFLAMIRQMEEGAGPAVTGNGGRVVKQEADNLFAVFDDPTQALEAALDIFRAFDAMNAVVPEGRDLHGSIGIGYGDTLVIGDEDLYGNEMNLACKLGEDVARQAQILLTAAAHDALPQRRYSFVPDSVSLGGLVIPFYRFEARRTVRPRKDAKAPQPRRRRRPG